MSHVVGTSKSEYTTTGNIIPIFFSSSFSTCNLGYIVICNCSLYEDIFPGYLLYIHWICKS